MGFQKWVIIWLFLSLGLAFEYVALNQSPHFSLMVYLQQNLGLFKTLNLSTEAGKPISFFLGWAGFSVMLLTNLYILRKRTPLLGKSGKLPNWLNFHIFCGLFGPTLIVFHTDMKVGGLVAISFWSMIIVAASGVIGRYFYIQVLATQSKSKETAERLMELFETKLSEAGIEADDDLNDKLKNNALIFAGIPVSFVVRGIRPGMISSFANSILGDIRIFWSNLPIPQTYPEATREILTAYGLYKRQNLTLGYFQKLLGYWHSFHLPFTFAMYIAAIIHIIVALLFLVPS